jgi:hypothetical protein
MLAWRDVIAPSNPVGVSLTLNSQFSPLYAIMDSNELEARLGFSEAVHGSELPEKIAEAKATLERNPARNEQLREISHTPVFSCSCIHTDSSSNKRDIYLIDQGQK